MGSANSCCSGCNSGDKIKARLIDKEMKAKMISQKQEQKTDYTLPQLSPPFVKVHAINTGTISMNESIVIENGSKDVSIDMTCLCFLIQHPSHSPLLFDLGLSTELSKPNYGTLWKHSLFFNLFNIKIDPKFKSLSHCIQTRFGYDAKDIKNIILSHYHWDHCGDPKDFPDATLIIDKETCKVQNAGCCRRMKQGFWGFEIPKDIATKYIEWTPNCTFGPFDKCKDLYGDGTIFIIDAPGHVLGHVMLIAKCEDGWTLLAADGVYSSESYNGDKPIAKGSFKFGPTDVNPETAFETISKIYAFYNMKNTIVRQAHFTVEEFDSIQKISQM
eukprot:495110_1